MGSGPSLAVMLTEMDSSILEFRKKAYIEEDKVNVAKDKLKRAVRDGDTASQVIYAREQAQYDTMRLHYISAASTISVAISYAGLQHSTQTLNKQTTRLMRSLSSAARSCDPKKIDKLMSENKTQFEEMTRNTAALGTGLTTILGDTSAAPDLAHEPPAVRDLILRATEELQLENPFPDVPIRQLVASHSTVVANPTRAASVVLHSPRPRYVPSAPTPPPPTRQTMSDHDDDDDGEDAEMTRRIGNL
jgi:hypothetical protein